MATITTKKTSDNLALLILGLTLVYCFFTQYILITAFAGVVLVGIIRMSWVKLTPPVLTYYLVFTWLQIYGAVLYADASGKSLDELYNVTDASVLMTYSLLHVLIMSVAIASSLQSAKFKVPDKQKLIEAANKIDDKKVIIGYLVTLVAFPLSASLFRSNAFLLQLFYSMQGLEVIFVALLFFLLLLKKTANKTLISLLLVVNFILSFVSFFSDFKTFFLIIIIVYLTVFPKVKRSTILRFLPIGVVLIVFLSFWSYVKGDYRAYLNQGTKQQVIEVSTTDALKYIFEEITEFNTNNLKEGASFLLYRIQYMEHYFEVYSRVPEVIPHANGEELGNALSFALIPRFINQDKGLKDASARTSYYTGKHFARASQGTSISMGYFPDLYIDFGLLGMIIPLIVLAVILTALAKFILKHLNYNLLLVYSILIGVFLNIGLFESDIIFLLGTIRNNLAFLVLGYFTFFPYINRYITIK